MYAILDIAGVQYQVQEGEKLKVPRLNSSAGDTLTLDKVMLVSRDKESLIGKPYVKGASVSARVLETGKEKKVIVFKFKRRTKYRRKRGHRQPFTELRIEKINLP